MISGSLEYLNLTSNNFSGDIPSAIGGLSQLKVLELAGNLFDGSFPPEIGNLLNLEFLVLSLNGFAPQAIPSRFTQLKKLRNFWMTQANLAGGIPEDIGNMTALEFLDLSVNGLSGSIPNGLFQLKNLTKVYLYDNRMSGNIPESVMSFNLDVDLCKNNLTGKIPGDFGKLKKLSKLIVFDNNLTGELPDSLGNCDSLNYFRAENNSISGNVPDGLWTAEKLSTFMIQDNLFTGQIPHRVASNLSLVDIRNNRFSGELPTGMSTWHSLSVFRDKLTALPELTVLLLDGNTLSRNFPSNISSWKSHPSALGLLPNLIDLDLSSNQLSGDIPTELGNLRLTSLNLSCNCQSGRIPTQLESANFDRSFLNNPGLCASNPSVGLSSCKGKDKFPVELVAALASGAAFTFLVAVTCILFVFRSHRKKSNVWFQHGSRYHSTKSKLLVYEYMENRSLDIWLHSKNRLDSASGSAPHLVLGWPRRLQIAIGAARGLCYMHHDYSPPIIHRDVKSRNILLDTQFNAKIADFGLARMLLKPGDNTVTAVAGFFGYIAPEYAWKTKVTQKIDVYSFGVILLELVTGKEANLGDEDSCLAEWAWRHLQKGKPIADALDEDIKETRYFDETCTVFKLGIFCTSTFPSSRPTMKEVLQILIQFNKHDVLPLLKKSRRERIEENNDTSFTSLNLMALEHNRVINSKE
ncbi:unnamed protein product [Withania somnifera]